MLPHHNAEWRPGGAATRPLEHAATDTATMSNPGAHLSYSQAVALLLSRPTRRSSVRPPPRADPCRLRKLRPRTRKRMFCPSPPNAHPLRRRRLRAPHALRKRYSMRSTRHSHRQALPRPHTMLLTVTPRSAPPFYQRTPALSTSPPPQLSHHRPPQSIVSGSPLHGQCARHVCVLRTATGAPPVSS